MPPKSKIDTPDQFMISIGRDAFFLKDEYLVEISENKKNVTSWYYLRALKECGVGMSGTNMHSFLKEEIFLSVSAKEWDKMDWKKLEFMEVDQEKKVNIAGQNSKHAQIRYVAEEIKASAFYQASKSYVFAVIDKTKVAGTGAGGSDTSFAGTLKAAIDGFKGLQLCRFR
jgi:hypothetical protein